MFTLTSFFLFYLPSTNDYLVFHKASFGHGNFQIFNATTAQWTWHENSNSESQISDSVIVTCKA